VSLIWMGGAGKGCLHDFFFGSTVHEVLLKSKRPGNCYPLQRVTRDKIWGLGFYYSHHNYADVNVTHKLQVNPG